MAPARQRLPEEDEGVLRSGPHESDPAADKTQGWTVFQIPSTPGPHRPPLESLLGCMPCRRGSPESRAARLGCWLPVKCPWPIPSAPVRGKDAASAAHRSLPESPRAWLTPSPSLLDPFERRPKHGRRAPPPLSPLDPSAYGLRLHPMGWRAAATTRSELATPRTRACEPPGLSSEEAATSFPASFSYEATIPEAWSATL